MSVMLVVHFVRVEMSWSKLIGNIYLNNVQKTSYQRDNVSHFILMISYSCRPPTILNIGDSYFAT